MEIISKRSIFKIDEICRGYALTKVLAELTVNDNEQICYILCDWKKESPDYLIFSATYHSVYDLSLFEYSDSDYLTYLRDQGEFFINVDGIEKSRYYSFYKLVLKEVIDLLKKHHYYLDKYDNMWSLYENNIDLSKIRKEINFRELGNLKTADQRRIKNHLFYRSAGLHLLNNQEKEILDQLHLDTVLDLRSQKEIDRHPDPSGSYIYSHISALTDENGNDVSFEPHDIVRYIIKTPKKKLLKDFYKILVFSNKSYQYMFDCLKENKVPFLFHCSAGKDRTGVAACLLLLALGINKETIIEDYLQTNEYRKELIDKKMQKYYFMNHLIPQLKYIHMISEGVLREGIETVFLLIEEKYDSYEDFFEQEYGLTVKDLDQLKEKYLY